MEALVYVIVLTYNGKKWIDNCLDSVLKTVYSNFKVLLIDNASHDGIVEYLKNRFPSVEVIKNDKNLGFGQAMNIGIKVAQERNAKYIILLNQDTRVNENWITELVKVAEAASDIGVLTPLQYDYEGRNLDINFVTLIKDEHYMDKAFLETDTIIGAATFIKKEVFEKIGYFDPIYFLYAEESDFCRRAKAQGYKIGIAVRSKISHWHTLLHKKDIGIRNRYLFIKNNFIYTLTDKEKSLREAIFSYYKLELRKFYSRSFLKSFLSLLLKVTLLWYLPIIMNKRNEKSIQKEQK